MKKKDVSKIGKFYELCVSSIMVIDDYGHRSTEFHIRGFYFVRDRWLDGPSLHALNVVVESAIVVGLALERRNIRLDIYTRFIINDVNKGPVEVWLPRNAIYRVLTKSRLRHFEKAAL